MSLDDSITVWIDGLRDGNEESAQRLWERYFARLVFLANARLPQGYRRDFDEEDVALSAFHSLCAGVQAGKFPRLDDRDNLWSLLVVITARKAMRQMRHATRQKRGGGGVKGESAFGNARDEQLGFDEIVGREPTAEFAVEVAEESERLLAMLPDEEMKKLAVLKMEGFNNREAAEELDCGLRTVQRRLGIIKQLWATELPAD